MTMHLAINATEIGRQRGGNETHLLGLLEGLARQAAAWRLSLIVTAAGAQDERLAKGPWQVVSVGPYRRIPFLLWQQTLALRQIKPDWYLSTYFLPAILPCRGAVIVHDLSFAAHPEYYPRHMALYMRGLTGRAIRQAQRVLVDSDFTRRELARYYPEAGPKAAIIWNGVSSAFTTAARSDEDWAVLTEYGIREPYLLAMGNIHPRKNLARLLEAYLQLRGQVARPPAMVWVGMPHWGSAELIRHANRAGVILTGYVPPQHLPALYRRASVFIYPSLYEGFGLPVLEAMACGAPVVCSQTTSLPEVAGNAALLVDPENAGEIMQAMRALYEDPAEAARFRQLGLRQAGLFTWDETARLLAEALGRGQA